MNCAICELRCLITDGGTGACGLYELKGNRIVERNTDHYLTVCPISIETMPILHFHPGTKFLQITTTGCNFNCPGCISTVLVREMDSDSPALQYLTAEQIISKAFKNRCAGIAFLMNDPLAAFPRFLAIARMAHDQKLKVGCSSNAFFTMDSLQQLIPYLDFINIGMKGFSDKAYRACGATGVSPVLRNLRVLYEAGVHIEVSCILTRENQFELLQLAEYIAGLSRSIPLQVMRFLPFETASIEKEPSILEAEDFCKRLFNILDFVYLFNTPGSEYLHTCCPQCKKTILRRDFYGPMGAKLIKSGNLKKRLNQPNRCSGCEHQVQIIGAMAQSTYSEGDFEGGYPFTRAMEMVEAMLIAMGVTRKNQLVRAWEDVLRNDGLKKLHKSIQHPRTYIEAVRYFGKKADVSDRAEALAVYLEDRLSRVETRVSSVPSRPKVYYAMGKPLFYINASRLENQLVETAGGISVNREFPFEGRPGRTLTAADLNRLDPEVIFISAFISNTVEDFYAECLSLNLTIDAVQNKRIYVHPSPGWDFGSPRWILGLMNMASILHPDRCAFNIMAEADAFYRTFYGIPFNPRDANRSFSKPDCHWRWQDE